MENTINKENKATTGASMSPIGTVAPKTKVNALPVTGKFDFNNDGYFVAVLDNPFPDEILPTLTLTFANPNRQDRFSGKVNDRGGDKREGAFRACTRKAGGPVSFKGECTYHIMTGKKGDEFDYIAIYVFNPFPGEDINDGNPTRVYLKQGSAQGEFDFFAMKSLELTPQKEFYKRR